MADDEDDAVYVSSGRASWLPKEEELNPPPQPGEWSDIGNTLASAGYGLASDVGAAGEYIGGKVGSALGIEPPAEGKTRATRLREWGAEGAAEHTKALSTRTRKALDASFLPEEGADIWDKDVSMPRALAYKFLSSSPSLAASVIPGTVVARAVLAAGGTAAAAGALGGAAGISGASTLTAGGVANNIEQQYRDMSDAQLQEQITPYAWMRDNGYDEKAARKALSDQVVGYKPLVMGAITGLLANMGAEKLAASLVAGTAKKGFAKNVGKGFLGELAEEAPESGAESYLTQSGKIEGLGGKIDWTKVLAQTIEGGVVGGMLGGVTGGVFGHGRDHDEVTPVGKPKPVQPEVDPDVASAVAAVAPPAENTAEGILEAANAPPGTTPPAGPGTPPAVTATPKADVLEEEVDLGAEDDGVDPAAAAAIVAAPPTKTPDQVAAQVVADAAKSASLQPTVQPAAPVVQPTVVPTAQPQPQGAGVPADAGAAPVEQSNTPPALLHTPPVEVPTGVTPEPAPEPVPVSAPPPMTRAQKQAAKLAEIKARGRPKKAVEPAPVATAETPAAPRVLPSQTEEAKWVESEDLAAFNEQVQQQAKEIGKASGDIKTHERTRDIEAVSGAAIRALRQDKFRIRATAIAEAQGDAAPAPIKAAMKEMADRVGVDPNSKEWRESNKRLKQIQEEAAQHYEQVEKERRGAIATQYDTRDSTAEAIEGTGGRVRQQVKKRGAKADKDAKLAEVWKEDKGTDPKENDPDPQVRGNALADRITRLVGAAKEAGVTLPTEVTPTTPLYQRVLIHLRDAIPDLRKKGERKRFSGWVTDMMIAERLARSGNPEEAANFFTVESGFGEQVVDEAQGQQAKADSVVYQAAMEKAALTAAPSIEETLDQTEEEKEAAEAPHIVTERPAVAENKEGPEAVRGGVKEGTVKTEVKKARTITKPPSPLKLAKEFVFGLVFTKQTKAGEERTGTAPDGTDWKVKLKHDYGYFNRTKGADGEQIDAYVGPGRRREDAPNVYVINQQDPATGKFDEHKAMVGFADEEAAMKAYEEAFSDKSGPSRIQSVDVMSVDDFKEWLKRPQTKPSGTGITIDPEVTREGNRYAAEEAVMAHAQPSMMGALESLLRRITGLRDATPLKTEADVAAVAKHATNLDRSLFGSRVRARDGVTEFHRKITMPIAEAARKISPDTKVYYLSEADMLRDAGILADIESGKITGKVQAWYNTKEDYIVINEALRSNAALEHRVLTHEAMHVILGDSIEYSTKAKAAVTHLLQSARDHFDRINAILPEPSPRYYGLENEHEFISEAMSDPAFQAFLAGIPAPGGWTPEGTLRPRDMTLWDRFIQYAQGVISFLTGDRIPYNALDATMRVTGHLFDVSSDIGRRVKTEGDAARARQYSMGDRMTGAGMKLKEWGYGLSTLEYLRQRGTGLFKDAAGDALDFTAQAMQRLAPRARALREATEKLAVEFMNHAGMKPKEAADMADLAYDFTSNNIKAVDSQNDVDWEKANGHLGQDATKGWQAKARLPRLRKRFMAMSPESRALFLKMSDHFTEMENANTKATVNSILDSAKGLNLTQAQRDDIVQRTMDGKLRPAPDAALTKDQNKAKADAQEDADVTLLGKGIYNDLKAASSLSRIKGTYFPLMRHGEYIVTSKAKLDDDLKGGVLMPDGNTVEFRGTDNTKLRDAARNLVRSTDMTVDRTTRVFYDKQTGKVVSADDARGRDVEIAYRVKFQREGMHAFDSPSAAARFIREEGGDFESVSKVMKRADINFDNTLSAQQMAGLISAVNNNDKLSDVEKAQAVESIKMASVRMLPGNRVQKHRLKRKNVAGANKDMARNMLTYGQAVAGNISRTENMPQIREGLARMRKIQKELSTFDPKADQRSRMITAMESRFKKGVVDQSSPNAAVQNIMTLSALDKLGSLSYSIVNAMQPMMTTLPVLSGRYGDAAATYQMAKAYRDIGWHKISFDGAVNVGKAFWQIKKAALDTRDIGASVKARIAALPDGAKLGQVFDELRERGALDADAFLESAAAIERGAGFVGTALDRVDRAVRQLPSAVEQINRAVTAIATYRLSTQRGNSHEQAMQEAFETTMMTQFDYSHINSPALFNHPVAKMALQFKKYAVNIGILMYDLMRRSLDGTNPADRKIAMKQLGRMMAMQTLVGGAMGLPVFGLIKIPIMIAAMLGVGGGFEDLERWLKDAGDATAGKGLTEVLQYGLPRLLGVDLSSRVSLADLALFGEPRKYDDQGVSAYIANYLLGAPGSYALDLFSAGRDATQEGEYLKAFEKTFPLKTVADTAKAIREYQAGEIGVGGFAAKSVGLQPASLARRNQRIGKQVQEAADVEKTRKRMEKAYLNASPSDRKKMLPGIKEWNKNTSLRQKIFVGTLDKRAKKIADKRAGKYTEEE